MNAIKELKETESKLVNPGELRVLVLEAPAFWEKYFLWLIHLFVQKTAREISNENKRAEYQAEKEAHIQNVKAYNTQYEALEQKKNIIGNNQINGVLELKQKKAVLRYHLIKETSKGFTALNAQPQKEYVYSPIHTVVTVPCVFREVIVAEFMRFFIPETPKYRSIDGKDEGVSKKVGFNDDTKQYETLQRQHNKKKGQTTIEGLLRTNLDLAKQYYKIMIVSLLIGNDDSHNDNIMYGKDKNGKETLYPIDFDNSLSNDIQPCARAFKNMALYHSHASIKGLEEAIYEVSKIWHEKKQEIKLHLKQVCKAFDMTDDWYKDHIIEVIDTNKTFISQERLISEQYKMTLPPLIMGKQQVKLYEQSQNKQGAGQAV